MHAQPDEQPCIQEGVNDKELGMGLSCSCQTCVSELINCHVGQVVTVASCSGVFHCIQPSQWMRKSLHRHSKSVAMYSKSVAMYSKSAAMYSKSVAMYS